MFVSKLGKIEIHLTIIDFLKLILLLLLHNIEKTFETKINKIDFSIYLSLILQRNITNNLKFHNLNWCLIQA